MGRRRINVLLSGSRKHRTALGESRATRKQGFCDHYAAENRKDKRAFDFSRRFPAAHQSSGR